MFYANAVYSSTTCTQLWNATWSSITYGVTTAVANMDSDPEGEVLMCGNGVVRLFEHTGALKWSFPGVYGRPSLADFDGDGTPDVGVLRSNTVYNVLNGINGSLMKSINVDDSLETSSSAFDFQRDGKSEFVYYSDSVFYIISQNWTLNMTLQSYTASENAVITDIDLDGVADIIFVGKSVRVLNSCDSWAGSDVPWTQHGFNGMNYNAQQYPQVTTVTNSFRSRPAITRYRSLVF